MSDNVELASAAKSMLDNSEFNVLLSHIEKSMVQALLGGTPEDAERNLVNYKAVAGLRQFVSNLANV